MDIYITGATIKNLRERKGITQQKLAEKVGVSSKAVSKWETAKEGLNFKLRINIYLHCCNSSINYI